MSDYSRADRAELVLMALDDEGGTFSREAGYCLADLSFATGIPYKTLSQTLIQMEAEGTITIERAKHPKAHQANRLITIRVVS